ncbi:death-on-curing protein, partial [Mycoplasmoides pneumoniae]
LVTFLEKEKDCQSCICLFKSKLSSSFEIRVKFNELNLDASDEKTKEFLRYIVSKSINNAKFLSSEDFDDKKEDEILSIIENTFNSYCYKNDLLSPSLYCKEGRLNIIDLINDIFCKVLTFHKLSNGNKRLATALLVNFLYTFGYYFKWTIPLKKEEYFKYAHMIKNFVVSFEEHKRENRDEFLAKQTKKFIMDNILLALNFWETKLN